jgi:hypothetical protein
MKDMQEIERALRIVEAKLARVKTAAKERQARIRAKIAGLQGFAASEEATDAQRLEIRKALASLEAGMQNIMPPLEDVEKEVDRIYGDQSLTPPTTSPVVTSRAPRPSVTRKSQPSCVRVRRWRSPGPNSPTSRFRKS